MNNIIKKTYELIDTLDNSLLIKELSYYKDKVINDKYILDLINKYNNSNNNEEKITIKKELYNNINYIKYMENYNKLNYIIMDINNRIKKITNTKVTNY